MKKPATRIKTTRMHKRGLISAISKEMALKYLILRARKLI